MRLITSQLRRSALSIAANVADGYGKSSRAKTIHFLEIAAGSTAETGLHLLVARDIVIMTSHKADGHLTEVPSIRRMLRVLSLRLPPDPGTSRTRRNLARNAERSPRQRSAPATAECIVAVSPRFEACPYYPVPGAEYHVRFTGVAVEPRRDRYEFPSIASANFRIASSCSGVSLSGTCTETSTIRSPRDPSRSIP